MKLILLIPTPLNLPYPGLQYKETARRFESTPAKMGWQKATPGPVRALLCYFTFLQRSQGKENPLGSVLKGAPAKSLQWNYRHNTIVQQTQQTR